MTLILSTVSSLGFWLVVCRLKVPSHVQSSEVGLAVRRSLGARIAPEPAICQHLVDLERGACDVSDGRPCRH